MLRIESDEAYAEFVQKLLNRNFAEFTQTILEEVGIFFVYKGGKVALRVFVDARRPNMRFVKPPKAELASPACIADVWVDSDETVFTSGNDLVDYFYRLELPACIRSFFGLRSVKLALIDHPEARRLEGLGMEYSPLRLRVVPMGWTWSLWYAQVVHEQVFFF